MIESLIKKLRKSNDGSENWLLKKIHTIDEFPKIINYEKSRADRGNHQFSLIMIDMRQIKNGKGLNESFLDELCLRVRNIDEIWRWGRGCVVAFFVDIPNLITGKRAVLF